LSGSPAWKVISCVDPRFAGGTSDLPGYAGSISVIVPTAERELDGSWSDVAMFFPLQAQRVARS
jgi:hypothetical protein